MTDLREIIAKNITDLRVSRSMTQLKLAELLNYSDKAVSKWERAESLPDVTVLKEIADIFGVSVDYLISPTHEKAARVSRGGRNKILVTLLSFASVYLVATVVFVALLFADIGGFPAWAVYLYALIPGGVVLLIFNSIWGVGKINYLIISLLIWSVLLSIYITLNIFSGVGAWLVFLLGIPAELIVFIWSFMTPKNKSAQDVNDDILIVAKGE